MTTFSYTEAERQHLDVLRMELHYNPQFQDVEYLRMLADKEASERYFPLHEGMHPDDCDSYTTPEEWEEMIAEIECGMQRGETL